MTYQFEELTFKKLVAKAKKDIKYLRRELIPMLKSKNLYSVADMQDVLNSMLNAGLNMNYFFSVAYNVNHKTEVRAQAEMLYEEYKDVINKTNSVLDSKQPEEKECSL